MTFQIHKAQRQKSKLRVGIYGPSGSGKTYSALQVAYGITGDWSKIGVIDTENWSADLYSHLGEYSVLTLEAPFTPERCVQAIEAMEGFWVEVIIFDSITHEWDGKGWCLEMNDQIAKAKFKGNTWSAWSETTPRHQAFIDKIILSKTHIITTSRAKMETAQIDGKVKKIGIKEVQREGYEYELTINFSVERDTHMAMASKDRTGLYIDRDPFLLSPDIWREMKEWADSGIDVKNLALDLYQEYKDKMEVSTTIDELKATFEEMTAKKHTLWTYYDSLCKVKDAVKVKFQSNEPAKTDMPQPTPKKPTTLKLSEVGAAIEIAKQAWADDASSVIEKIKERYVVNPAMEVEITKRLRK